MVGPEVQAIVGSMGSALVYSFLFYAKKRAGKDKQTLEPKKLTATLVVGAAIGGFYAYYGIPIDKPTIMEQLATYGGTIALVEAGIKTVYRMAMSYMGKQ
jgi:hypothetical protein